MVSFGIAWGLLSFSVKTNLVCERQHAINPIHFALVHPGSSHQLLWALLCAAGQKNVVCAPQWGQAAYITEQRPLLHCRLLLFKLP
jgi:hypothetical protein